MRWFSFALLAACSNSSAPPMPDGLIPPLADLSLVDVASPPDLAWPDTLDGNRDRLLQTYLERLQSIPSVTQSNGLVGSNLPTVCALWNALDPSSRDVFLTITHRLWGATLAADGSHALTRVEKLYRLNGGMGATTGNPGSCGGGEYNRAFFHIDTTLHDTLVTANTNKGAGPDIHDIPASGFWRDSHDLGGPHAPFDLSDETNDGAPRGQVQYFRDPTSTLANTALGRADVTTLVDPYALEMDQDYDCVHNSNPDCTYITYGPLCAPETSKVGVDIYMSNYGAFEPTWKPNGC
jgi:hypothetical protein